jgi:hypothetical protein
MAAESAPAIVLMAKCQRRRRSRAGKNSFQRGVVGGEIGGGMIQRDGVSGRGRLEKQQYI